MNETIKSGRYRHFKGIMVEVIGTARHSETLEEFVVYKHIAHPPGQDDTWWQKYGENSLWVRPKAMFLEIVEKEGKKIPRFEFIENSD